MEKLSVRKRIIIIFSIFIGIFLPILTATSLYYSKSVLNLIYNSFSQFSNEFIFHDVELIQDDFMNKKEKLNFGIMHLGSMNFPTDKDYVELVEESFINDFSEIAFLDSNNEIINGRIINDYKEQILQVLSGHEEINLVNIKDNPDYKDCVLYVLKVKPFSIKNRTYKAIIGLCKIDDFYEKIRITSPDSTSKTMLFTNTGDFLNTDNNFASLNNKSNLYDYLADVSLLKITASELETNINNHIDTDFFFKNNKKITHIQIKHIKNSNVYYLFSLPEEDLRIQSKKIIEFTTFLIMILFIAISIFIVVSILVVYKFSNLRLQSKTKEEFLSTMSHEIRTPLNGIIGLIHLMETNMDDKDKLKYYFQKTSKTSDYLLQLINNILDISKFDNGKIKLANNPFDIEEMLDSIVSINRDTMLQKNINFQVKRNIFCSTIYGDEIRIQQIIMNLIGNAVKFTQENGTITFTVIQENTFETDEISTIFTISDNGCGISIEFQKHIFEAFSQERNKLKASQKGTGLGLAISHRLCEQMNGSLTVESELGIGSTFIFSLPAKIATPKQVTDYILSATNFNTEKEHNILIAEDNELSADILDEVFNDVNFKHKIVRDGKQVIEEFSESEVGEYDVILMDIQMPYYDGYEATQIIRKLKRADAKTVTIIACSANAFEEDKENAIKAGMNSFIVKPVNINSLLEILGK